jgi:hypothetical protein
MRFHHWIYVCVVILILFVGFRQKPEQARKEMPVSLPASSTSESSPPREQHSLPPTRAEVVEAVRRVFGEVVFVPQHTEFVAADFDGDHSEDLAAVVEVNPAAREQAEAEFANWTVQDVREPELPPSGVSTYTYVATKRRLHIRGSHLLTVIHGYGVDGWRDPEARQAYLLTHAVGEQLGVAAMADIERQGVALPRMSANPTRTITEVINHRHVAIYWTGAQYAVR